MTIEEIRHAAPKGVRVDVEVGYAGDRYVVVSGRFRDLVTLAKTIGDPDRTGWNEDDSERPRWGAYEIEPA